MSLRLKMNNLVNFQKICIYILLYLICSVQSTLRKTKVKNTKELNIIKGISHSTYYLTITNGTANWFCEMRFCSRKWDRAFK